MERGPIEKLFTFMVGKVNIVKIVITSKFSYRFNLLPIEIPDACYSYLQSDSKIYLKIQECKNSQDDLIKKKKCEDSYILV
jgi:hypothetical protein